MSKLKERLAVKVSDLFGYEVKPEDISFLRNGPRGDVVRWTVEGCECFSAAGHSVKKRVELSLSEFENEYGAVEIYAEPPC